MVHFTLTWSLQTRQLTISYQRTRGSSQEIVLTEREYVLLWLHRKFISETLRLLHYCKNAEQHSKSIRRYIDKWKITFSCDFEKPVVRIRNTEDWDLLFDNILVFNCLVLNDEEFNDLCNGIFTFFSHNSNVYQNVFLIEKNPKIFRDDVKEFPCGCKHKNYSIVRIYRRIFLKLMIGITSIPLKYLTDIFQTNCEIQCN